MTDDLRDRLDDMLAKLAPSPAPIEAAMRQGKRIRWRRRATAAAGLAMVIAAAAIVPSTVHFGAAPEPATTHRGVHYSVTVTSSRSTTLPTSSRLRAGPWSPR